MTRSSSGPSLNIFKFQNLDLSLLGHNLNILGLNIRLGLSHFQHFNMGQNKRVNIMSTPKFCFGPKLKF